jgi:hypothetical protein
LSDPKDWNGDPEKIDSVHSLWEATTHFDPELGTPEWPVQAQFKLLVRLKYPVPKSQLIEANVLAVPRWPQRSRGKILAAAGVNALGILLRDYNPTQRRMIRAALGC